MKIINNKTEKDNTPYISGIMGKKIGLYAESLYDAKKKAEAHFKPNKSNRGLLWVERASEE